MNNFEIHNILKSNVLTRNVFVSVHSSDNLPIIPRKEKPCAYIANTDKATEEGQHWVCFYFPKYSLPEYFDSYGVHPHKSFEMFLQHDYVKNMRFIQHPFSTVCGQYTIFYILYRCKGYTMNEIVNMFHESNKLDNDIFVNDIIKTNFGENFSVFDVDFLNHNISKSLM